MILLRLLLIIVVGALTLSSSKADDLTDYLIDIDKVRIAVTLDLSLLVHDAGQGHQWVLGTIAPKPGGNILRVHSSYIDGKTGISVQDPKGVDFYLVEGNINSFTALTGAENKNARSYSWKIPGSLIILRIRRGKNKLPLDNYQPFIKGGVVILLLDSKNDKLDKLPVYQVVPPEWQNAVAPAFKSYQEKSQLFSVENASLNRAALNTLLMDANPILSIAACRTLLKANLVEPSSLKALLSQAKDLQQAALVYLLLREPSESARNKILRAVKEVVTDSKDPEQLKGVALGALAAYRGSDYSVGESSFEVLDALEKKQVGAENNPSNRYINGIIDLASLHYHRASIKAQQDALDRTDRDDAK